MERQSESRCVQIVTDIGQRVFAGGLIGVYATTIRYENEDAGHLSFLFSPLSPFDMRYKTDHHLGGNRYLRTVHKWSRIFFFEKVTLKSCTNMYTISVALCNRCYYRFIIICIWRKPLSPQMNMYTENYCEWLSPI